MQFGLFDEDANPLVGEISPASAERILRPGFRLLGDDRAMDRVPRRRHQR
jgi:hypothetical protein